MSLKSISNQSATCCNAQNTYLKIKLAQQNLTNMKFSDSTKQAIANATGLVYLADNLEKRAATEGEEVAKMLRFYCPTREAHQVIEETVLPDIKATNPGFDYPGSGDVPEPPVEEVLKALKASIVFDEASYNAIVDEEYRKQWTWEQSKPSMPWLVVDIEKTKEDAVVDLKMTAGNAAVVFAASCDSVGTRSEDSATLTTGYKRVMFECIKDLQVSSPWEQNFVVTAKQGDTIVTAEAVCPAEPVDPPVPEKQLPEVTSTMEPNVVANKDFEFEVATTANDYKNTMVYALLSTEATTSDINKIQYWEPNEEVPSWHDLQASEDGSYRFGPESGFPLLDTASKFKLNMKSTGSFDFKVSIKTIEDNKTLCSINERLEVSAKKSIKSIAAAFVHDEASYNEYVDAAYREQYDFEASKDSMPWLVVDIDKADAEARPQLAIKAGNAEVVFAESCDNVGSRSNENKTLTLNANVAKYAMFECIKDLQVAEPFGIKWTVAAQVEDEAALSASVDAPVKQKATRAAKK